MLSTEINKGTIYSNGRGGVRRVDNISKGRLGSLQVNYTVLFGRRPTRSRYRTPEEGRCELLTFARWAKGEYGSGIVWGHT